MKKTYQSPAIQVIPLASQFSFCDYAVSGYKDGGSQTVGASETEESCSFFFTKIVLNVAENRLEFTKLFFGRKYGKMSRVSYPAG